MKHMLTDAVGWLLSGGRRVCKRVAVQEVAFPSTDVRTLSPGLRGLWATAPLFLSGCGAGVVAVADLDADGDEDLVATETSIGFVMVLLQSSPGSFQLAGLPSIFPT